jgi:hypothetical protein
MDNDRPPVVAKSSLPDLSLRQAEEVKHLGELQESYTPDTSSRLLWVGFMLFFLLLGLLVLAIPFLPRAKGVPPASLPVVLLILLVIGLMLVGCFWRLRRLSWERRVRLLLFAEGLAQFDGKSLQSGRWEDIESVQGLVYKAPRAFASHVIITLRGGQTIRMFWARERVAIGEALYRRLSEESGRYLLPRCFAAVEAGQTVTFSAPDAAWLGGIAPWSRIVLGISKSGLHWGKQVVTWDDAANIDWNDGVRIRTQHQTGLGAFHSWVRLADIPIPNSLVCLRLAEHYLRKSGPQAGVNPP